MEQRHRSNSTRDKFSRGLKLCFSFRFFQLVYLVLNYLPLWMAMPSTPIGYVLVYSSGVSKSTVLSRYCFPLTFLAIIGEMAVIAWIIKSSSRK